MVTVYTAEQKCEFCFKYSDLFTTSQILSIRQEGNDRQW